MPWKTTLKRAAKARREGKRPTTVAGEFVREEMEHVRRGKHGVRSPQQAIAIGLSKARRAGVDLPPPKPGRAKPKTIASAKAASRAARSRKPRSAKRSRAAMRALKREPRTTASRAALAKQARAAAARRRRRGAATAGVRPLQRATMTRRRRRTTSARQQSNR